MSVKCPQCGSDFIHMQGQCPAPVSLQERANDNVERLMVLTEAAIGYYKLIAEHLGRIASHMEDHS